MSEEMEDSVEAAIEQLKSLEEGDNFLLITRTGDRQYGLQAFSGDTKRHISLLNHTAVPLLYMNQNYDDYPLDQVASDVLDTARVQAQGGRLSE
ncbi:hypothetical protein [Halorubrum sp. FL23]|uniref:hypothetical protein n=1 Tax=Halorubrum sp. FL23 TaxID=3458704 RepID=UPI004034E82F